MKALQGKAAIVTGASTPLGETIAVALAGQGVKECVSGLWADTDLAIPGPAGGLKQKSNRCYTVGTTG